MSSKLLAKFRPRLSLLQPSPSLYRIHAVQAIAPRCPPTTFQLHSKAKYTMAHELDGDLPIDFHTRELFNQSALSKNEAPFTSEEKSELKKWLKADHNSSDFDSQLNNHLATRTTILGNKPSIVDVALYRKLAPKVAKWTPEERTGEKGYHHVVRWVDFVQNADIFGLPLKEGEKVKIDPDNVIAPIKPIDAKAEKERKKKEKEAAAAAAAGAGAGGAGATAGAGAVAESAKDKSAPKEGAAAAAAGGEQQQGEKKQKKEKKEKQPKPQKQPAPEKPLSPCLIDLRVGHILKAVQHPNADSLYVSTIACGDAPGTDNTSEHEGQVVRTVCSGLNGLVPLEEMQGRKIVAVCNLKPVTMRGVKSAAMVLAASPRLAEGQADDHKGPVELVNPPKDAMAGTRVYFEGWEGEPEGQLNPKKKIWETLQPGFTTTEGLQVGFDVSAVPQLAEQGKSGVGKLVTKEGPCLVTSLKGATVR